MEHGSSYQVNFHANAGWCRAEGHDVTWRRPPLVAACILKPLHDCYSSLRMMLHPCWWGLASYHNLFDVSFWIRSNEPPPWAHKRKILAKWMLPRHQIPKPSSGAVYHQILDDFLMKVCMWATLKVLRRGMSSVKKASELVGSCILKRKEKESRSTYLILFSGPQESSCCSFKYLKMREAFLEAKHSTCLEGSRQQQNSSLSPFLKGGQSPVTGAGLRQGAKLRGLGTGNLSANQNASPPVL